MILALLTGTWSKKSLNERCCCPVANSPMQQTVPGLYKGNSGRIRNRDLPWGPWAKQALPGKIQTFWIFGWRMSKGQRSSHPACGISIIYPCPLLHWGSVIDELTPTRVVRTALHAHSALYTWGTALSTDPHHWQPPVAGTQCLCSPSSGEYLADNRVTPNKF